MCFSRFRILAAGLSCVLLLCAPVARAASISEADFKARIEQVTKNFKDLTMVYNITYKNKKALSKCDDGYVRAYECKSANVYIKAPDKIRTEGKLGMVKVEYIINGTRKLFRAPAIRVNKKENYPDDPAKLQTALDLGLITTSLWRNRKIEIINDPEAQADGEIKVLLRWPKGDMLHYIWVDEKTMALKKFEKRDGAQNLLIRVVYSNHKNVGGVIWAPTKVEMYSSEGEKAGASEVSGLTANTGLADSLFE